MNLLHLRPDLLLFQLTQQQLPRPPILRGVAKRLGPWERDDIGGEGEEPGERHLCGRRVLAVRGADLGEQAREAEDTGEVLRAEFGDGASEVVWREVVGGFLSRVRVLA